VLLLLMLVMMLVLTLTRDVSVATDLACVLALTPNPRIVSCVVSFAVHWPFY
jgi:ribosomal protein S12 methylthiotransferase accessory factor YcaO